MLKEYADLTTTEVAEEVALIMPRISRRIFSDFLEHVNIPHAQLFVVLTLFHNGPCRVNDLCRELKVSAPTTTGILNRLSKAGYIERSVDAKDRRAVTVGLTAEGRTVALKLRKAAVRLWSEVLMKLPDEDVRKYLEILRKIKEVL